MENLTGGNPPVRPLPCVVPCKLYFAELLGSTPVIHDEAISYMWYIITFSPFLLFSFLLSGLVRNDNRPKLAMFALMFGSVSNIDITFTAVIFLDMFQFQNFIHIGRPPSSFLIA